MKKKALLFGNLQVCSVHILLRITVLAAVVLTVLSLTGCSNTTSGNTSNTIDSAAIGSDDEIGCSMV